MTLKQIAGLRRKLVAFLRLFSDCFGRSEPRELLRAYVKGQLSNLKRKNVEAIALQFRKAPRTLQRFFESIKWAVFWRKDRNGLPGRPHTLIVACNVLSGEMKYFVSNRVPGEEGVTLEWLLWVAFGRWPVERCFRETNDELGMDHFQVRGWRCVHRHYYITQLSQLFCARVRQEYEHDPGDTEARLTIEQVRGAACVHLEAASLTPTARRERYQQELDKIDYHQCRNRQACKSHTKTRMDRLLQLGIDVDQLPTCQPDDW